MTGNDDSPAAQSTFEDIPREECLRLLATAPIGRVAVADFGTAPLVVPVNFAVREGTVVFRSDYGSKFRLAVLGDHPVSFEVDAVDPARRSGWSVLVQGRAREVTEPERLRLEPWAPGSKSHWVQIEPETVSGRRIRLAPLPDLDSAGYL